MYQVLGAQSTVLRVAGCLLFTSGGIALTLTLFLGGPSFWYLPCFCALVLLGLPWIWKPQLAAALSIGPLVAAAALAFQLRGAWLALGIGFLLPAVFLVVCALNGATRWKLPLVISLTFLGASFATDRLFTNKVSVRAYAMYVALDGNAPWGEVGREWSSDVKPIVLYRKVGSDYCYDAFYPNEALKNRLAGRNSKTVIVEYNEFSDFGKESSYNVRSVDGLLLNNAQHAVIDIDSFGGEIPGDNLESPATDPCH